MTRHVDRQTERLEQSHGGREGQQETGRGREGETERRGTCRVMRCPFVYLAHLAVVASDAVGIARSLKAG